MGVRLGRNAGGEGSNVAQSVECAPPTLRETSVRELHTSPSAPGKGVVPPTMKADASSGLPCMGYESFEAACGPCEADGYVLVRSVGTTSRTHSATTQDPQPKE